MENFIYDIPTKIYFGQGQIQHLSECIAKYGKRILLVYGGGSIKKNGVYKDILEQLDKADVSFVELSGVEPNPRTSTVERGVELCKKHHVNAVLAVGGGSVIDCAKVVCAGFFHTGSIWDIVVDPSLIQEALPLFAIPTMAATGSEMDHIAVITNVKTNEKIGTRHPLLRPKVSILDPSYTYSVSAYQTASGIADIMSHIMESYFSRKKGLTQENVAIALLKTCMESGLAALQNPNDYEARANLMWTSCWAINDFLKLGRPVAWSVHPIEHQLSAVYDITHEVGLAILTPHWMEYVLREDTVSDFAKLFKGLWDFDADKEDHQVALEGIQKLKEYYDQLGLPKSLSELNIDSTHFSEMAQKAAKQVTDGYLPLSEEDIVKIYEASL